LLRAETLPLPVLTATADEKSITPEMGGVGEIHLVFDLDRVFKKLRVFTPVSSRKNR
jgi:hypothetical protein